ncbi:hypothetical protein LUZ60_005125 [Juncus effusus]|nr:hypothetical protein LUZ60_005125 [Juncus effusus]
MESTFIKVKCNPNPIIARILVISLPLFYVSILQIPPFLLIKDTTFWFLMSNSIIIFIAADTGVLFCPSHDMCEESLYKDLVTYNSVRNTYFLEEQPKEINKSLVVKEKLGDDLMHVVVNKKPSHLFVKQNDKRDLSTRDIERVPNREVEKSLMVIDKLVGDRVIVIEEEKASPLWGNENVTRDIQKVSNKEAEKALIFREKLVDKSTSLVTKEELDYKALEVKNRFGRNVLKGKSLDPNVFNENRSAAFHEKRPLCRSVTQEKRCNSDQNHEYTKLSDEELNMRIEDFIRRYYREMRLQLSNESGLGN